MFKEYRIRRVGALVRVQIVHGLMDTTQFTMTGTMKQVRSWINCRVKNETGKHAFIVTDPYLAPSEVLTDGMQASRLHLWGVKDF